jgi:hypothetical protein
MKCAVIFFFFAEKETDINLAEIQKGPQRQKNYNQALLQADYASTTKRPV